MEGIEVPNFLARPLSDKELEFMFVALLVSECARFAVEVLRSDNKEVTCSATIHSS